ncbi:MAG: DUF3224 domain-containing protein [Thermoleophilaceae bacterium]
MRSTRKLVSSTTAVLALSALFAIPASAHPAGVAAGSFSILDDQKTPIGQVGGNTFVHEVASIQYMGGLRGVVTATDTIVVHADQSIQAFGSETCHSCTIGGRTGSFTAVFAFHSTDTGIAGREVFIRGSGGLAGLHGGGTFAGTPAGNTYSYAYRF